MSIALPKQSILKLSSGLFSRTFIIPGTSQASKVFLLLHCLYDNVYTVLTTVKNPTPAYKTLCDFSGPNIGNCKDFTWQASQKKAASAYPNHHYHRVPNLEHSQSTAVPEGTFSQRFSLYPPLPWLVTRFAALHS